MALMKCPECGKDVSSYAESCPSCGCPSRCFDLALEDKAKKAEADRAAMEELACSVLEEAFCSKR